jgi:hypothetical protein
MNARLQILRIALLALVLVSSTGHEWHHLAPTGCDEDRAGPSHACLVCQSLHAGALASQPPATLSAGDGLPTALAAPETSPPSVAAHGDARPRAPPLS